MKTYIIAEAGTGHASRETDERAGRALLFIGEAARARADAVKFQMFVPDEPLFCHLPGDDERMETRWRHTFISLDDWRLLKKWGDRLGIDVLWSVFQPTAVEWLKDLRPRYVKVASRAAEKFPYDALEGSFLVSNGFFAQTYHAADNFHSLSCVSKYPTPLEEAAYPRRYAGLSDHSGTVWPGLDAIAHGAKFLEVHFKIPDADMGNDEPACLTTDQLKLLTGARDAFARMHQD